jgi:hypothetical protein
LHEVREWIEALREYTKAKQNDLLLLALHGLKSNEALSLKKSNLKGGYLQVGNLRRAPA